MPIYYGVSKDDLEKIKPILEAEGIPLIGFSPSTNSNKFGKYVIKHWDKTTEYINLDKSLCNSTFFQQNHYLKGLRHLRDLAREHKPLTLKDL